MEQYYKEKTCNTDAGHCAATNAWFPHLELWR